MSRKCVKRKQITEENEIQNKKPICLFCKTDTKNKYYLGKMMARDDITAHYYCILFSPGLQQNGQLNEGFKGFLSKDIKKEIRRGSHLYCSYCRKKGAVIGCAVNECNMKFHLTCGLVNESFHSFHDSNKTFPSYCCEHRPNQRTARIVHKNSDDFCVICRDKVDRKPTPKTLWSPCCGHWLHRECVVKQAYHAGKHHLKCPKCNDKDVFVEEMKRFGVHVPSRDASWEKGNTFIDLYSKSYKCSADICLARKGREYNGDQEWELLACDGCGANAIHISCAKLNVNSDEWLCSLCLPVLNKKLKVVNN